MSLSTQSRNTNLKKEQLLFILLFSWFAMGTYIRWDLMPNCARMKEKRYFRGKI